MTREFLVHLVSLRTGRPESLVNAIARTVWPDYDGDDAMWTGYTPGNAMHLTTMVDFVCDPNHIPLRKKPRSDSEDLAA